MPRSGISHSIGKMRTPIYPKTVMRLISPLWGSSFVNYLKLMFWFFTISKRVDFKCNCCEILKKFTLKVLFIIFFFLISLVSSSFKPNFDCLKKIRIRMQKTKQKQMGNNVFEIVKKFISNLSHSSWVQQLDAKNKLYFRH
jgi:hypothetical protein